MTRSTATAATLDLIGGADVLGPSLADVAVTRERSRRRRLGWLAVALAVPTAVLWGRMLSGHTITPGLPSLPFPAYYLPAVVLVGLLAAVFIGPLLGAGRSPHVLYRPSEIATGLADVVGAGVVKEEVVKSLNLFLAHRTFRDAMGGTPRRAVLFEGPPGTGKTYMAKAMARDAGVPFLFVSSSAFQSMYYGQTNRKIRSYFRALRRAARAEGGAIGFIEEIDAVGSSRAGMGSSTSREGVAGVVNELLIQLQSFDEPPPSVRIRAWFVDRVNTFLAPHAQLAKPAAATANVLVVGATNRASDLDAALLRPGRFDRAIHFGLPGREDRREIIDYYLDRKAHTSDLDHPGRRDELSGMTFGYSPVMIEHLLDEALVWAIRRGATALDWADLQQAKLTEETGLKERVRYTESERQRIATHEAGHATVAHLVGADRRLDVLSIIKRRDALGMLAHSDREERFTKTRSEIRSLILIAFGGMVAEELWFGEAASGVAGDLRAATEAAAQMVGSLGMHDSLISYDAMAVAGAQNVVAKVLAHSRGRAAVDEVLLDCKQEVQLLLGENRHLVEGLRDALVERDELVGDEIVAVLAAADEVDLTDGALGRS